MWAPFSVATLASFSNRLGVEHVDAAWVADGNIEAFVHPIEEHDIGRAAQKLLTEDFSVRIERDQLPSVAGAEQTIVNLTACRMNGRVIEAPASRVLRQFNVTDMS